MVGVGELVLTEPARSDSALIFPPATEGLFVVTSQPRPDVMIELDKRSGEPLRLAVPAGHYLVRRRAGRSVGLSNVDLPFGGEARVDERAFRSVDYREAALKGGYVELRPGLLSVLGGAGQGAVAGTGAGGLFGAAYRHDLDAWFAEAGALAGERRYRGVGLSIDEWAASPFLAFGWRSLSLPVTLQIGGVVETPLVRQAMTRDQEAQIGRDLGLRPLPSRWQLGFGGGLLLGVEIPLGESLVLGLAGRGLVRGLDVEGQPGVTLGGTLTAGVGWRL
jgi:hypothetical protein